MTFKIHNASVTWWLRWASLARRAFPGCRGMYANIARCVRTVRRSPVSISPQWSAVCRAWEKLWGRVKRAYKAWRKYGVDLHQAVRTVRSQTHLAWGTIMGALSSVRPLWLEAKGWEQVGSRWSWWAFSKAEFNFETLLKRSSNGTKLCQWAAKKRSKSFVPVLLGKRHVCILHKLYPLLQAVQQEGNADSHGRWVPYCQQRLPNDCLLFGAPLSLQYSLQAKPPFSAPALADSANLFAGLDAAGKPSAMPQLLHRL